METATLIPDVKQGYIIDFDPDPWTKLDRKARNSIRKASRELYIREGTLEELHSLHWNPSYLPRNLQANQQIFVAVLDDSLPPISAILVERHDDHLIYRFAGNNHAYRNYQGNSYLLWHVVELYKMKGLRYLDLGGSQKPSIESFKRSFSTRTYTLKNKRTIATRVNYRVKHWLPYVMTEAVKCLLPSTPQKL